MREYSKIGNLKNIIYEELNDLANCKYALFDLPYHTNIGDGLIWEGERCFLNDIGAKCLHNSSNFTCDFPILPKDTVILIHGGGNLGDLYREHFNFHKRVLSHYPQNRVVFFPQTIFYQDQNVLKEDMEFLKRHGNVTLCARDKKSYDTVVPFISGGQNYCPIWHSVFLLNIWIFLWVIKL